MAELMKIQIGADVQSAVTGLNQVATVTTKTTQALSKLPNSSNQATQSLVNLSRVAQDAPYGFIGIANNLNPLLESFQRLKASSGSTGGALKALGASLTGAGGIGLALGVASSLLVVFGDKLFGAGKKAKEAKESTDEYAKSVENSFKSVAQEVSKVEVLIRFIQLETTSRKERVNAIKELQSIAPGYFATLNAETATVNQVTAAYFLYTLAIRKAIETKVSEKQLEGIVERRLKLQKELTGSQFSEVIINGRKVRQLNAIYDADGQITEKQRELNILLREESLLIDKIAKSKPPQLKATDFAVKSGKVKPDKIDKVDKVDFEIDRAGFTIRQFDVIIPEQTTFEKAIAEANKIVDAFKNTKFKVPFNIAFDIAADGEDLFSDNVVKSFEKAQSRLRNLKPIDVSALFTGFKEAQKNLQTQMEEWRNAAEIISGPLTSAFNGMFDAIVQGGDVMKGFFDGLKSAVVQLIQKLIQAAIFSAVLSAISGGSVSFLSSFKGLLGIGARAHGGPVGAGNPFIVGERGPELFVPNSSGRIVSNANTGRLSSGGLSGGNVVFQISGNNLVGVLARANQSQNRLA